MTRECSDWRSSTSDQHPARVGSHRLFHGQPCLAVPQARTPVRHNRDLRDLSLGQTLDALSLYSLFACLQECSLSLYSLFARFTGSQEGNI